MAVVFYNMGNRDRICRIALDVMGADAGPEAIIDGGIMAARELGAEIQIILVGKSDIIEEKLRSEKSLPDNIEVADAPHAIAMSDSATDGIRKKTSSIAIGLTMQKEGKADAFVSAGNTGAVMASSLLILGRIEGITRPAIVSFFPNITEKPSIVLDVGANVDCKPIHLYQFGVMGSVFASLIHKRTNPRVGLLSIGEERSKGNELVSQARELLEKSDLNFVGNLEGRDILNGKYDVVICDGFIGNIILKFAESIKGFLTVKLTKQVETNIFSRVGATLMHPFLKRLRKTFDYAEYGGAPLLGINGVSLICHGASSPRAIKNAIKSVVAMVNNRISHNIREEIILNNGKNNGGNGKQPDNGDRVVRSIQTTDE